LSGGAGGGEKVQAQIDSAVAERAQQRASHFSNRNRSEPITQELPPHVFEFAARTNVKG